MNQEVILGYVGQHVHIHVHLLSASFSQTYIALKDSSSTQVQNIAYLNSSHL